jgi:excinuclease UvrABC nuclease subunit
VVSSFEDIIASKLLGGRYTLRQRALLPSTSGIYFVTDERNYLLYIGKATNLQSRWAGSGHHRYKQLARKGLDKIAISYVLAPIAELDTLERQYIEALKPLLNNGALLQKCLKQ